MSFSRTTTSRRAARRHTPEKPLNTALASVATRRTPTPRRGLASLAATLLLVVLVAGCGAGNDREQGTAGPSTRSGSGTGLWSAGDDASPKLLDACAVIFEDGAPESNDEVVVVVDRTTSVADQPLPQELADQLRDLSLAGGTLSVVGVGGRGEDPDLRALRVPIGAPGIDGERETQDVQDFADQVPRCVAAMFLAEPTSTKPGTDLYAAMAKAAELVTPETVAVWTLSDMLPNTGQLALDAELLGLSPASAAKLSADQAPLSLESAPWHVSGLANATAVIQPSSREWMHDYVSRLCVAWRASACDEIALVPANTDREDAGDVPEDRLPQFPDVSVASRPASCEFTVPAVLAFAGDSSRLSEGAAEVLEEPIGLLLRSEARVVVTGHTASSSAYTADELLALSAARADRVADALRDGGVPPRRIIARGVGDTEPLAEDIDPATGRQIEARAAAERRVTITLEASCPR
jgi:outer membrane protein OmpA-like peptidoglycan-associated protein